MTRSIFLHLCCFSLSSFSPSAEPAPSDLLRQGLYAEEVTRDPAAAANQYEQIIAAEDQRRAIVATALFRLAEVRRQQGKKDEAIPLYQRLLREFPQAEAEGKLAREHLTALGGKIPEPGEAVIDKEAEELARLQAAATTSPDLVTDPYTLKRAAGDGWLSVVEFMLGKGANPYTTKECAIESAVEEGHLAICQKMVAQAGLPTGGQRADLLQSAIGEQRWTVLRFLLDQGISPDAGVEMGWPSVLATAAAADTEDDEILKLARLLLDYKADPNAVPAAQGGNKSQGTPLHAALKKGNFKMADLLLERGAKPDVIDNGTLLTPLHLVVTSTRPEASAMAAKLIDHGAKVNAIAVSEKRGGNGKSTPYDTVSPLQLAVDQEAWDCAKVLIARGADLKQPGLLTRYLPENAFGEDGRAEQERIDAKDSFHHNLPGDAPRDPQTGARDFIGRLKFLLDAGADPNVLDQQGYHPLSLIILAGKPKLLELFLQHGADPNIPFGKDPGKLPPPPQQAAAERRNAPGLLNLSLNRNWSTGSAPEAKAEMVRLLLKAGGKPGKHAATLVKLVADHDKDGSLTRELQKDAPAATTPPPSR
jgi:ankyrin repeat protein